MQSVFQIDFQFQIVNRLLEKKILKNDHLVPHKFFNFVFNLQSVFQIVNRFLENKFQKKLSFGTPNGCFGLELLILEVAQ